MYLRLIRSITLSIRNFPKNFISDSSSLFLYTNFTNHDSKSYSTYTIATPSRIPASASIDRSMLLHRQPKLASASSLYTLIQYTPYLLFHGDLRRHSRTQARELSHLSQSFPFRITLNSSYSSGVLDFLSSSAHLSPISYSCSFSN